VLIGEPRELIEPLICPQGFGFGRNLVTKLGNQEIFLFLALRDAVEDKLVKYGSVRWWSPGERKESGIYHSCPAY